MMQLLESKKMKPKGRSAGGTISSVILHVLVIFLAVFATANAGIRRDHPKAEKLNFVEVKKNEPPPPKKEPPPPPKKPEPPKPKPKTPEPPKLKVVEAPKVQAPAPPKGFQVVPPPVAIPTKLPSIDLSKAITNENDFSGKGVAGGTANGVKGGTGDENSKGKEAGEVKKPEPPEEHGPYMEFQVEKPVSKIGGEAPEYPPSLKDRGVEGSVIAQFVVGENGRYESGTLKILSSSDPAFTAAVKDALPRMRFSAAQIGGKKVQQLVQMPFQFHIAH
jgi:protein TonB